MQASRRRTGRGDSGFSLIELLVAAALFSIITAAALLLFSSHTPLFNQQQNLAQVNIGLRNAVAQMQLDVANAGANYYTGMNIPNYPVGVVITNNVVPTGGNCQTGSPLVYTSTCFDQMSIITADINTVAANPQSSSLGCINTSSATSGANGTVYLSPSGSTTGYGTVQSVATTAAANYLTGDQILFVNNNGSSYTTAKLVSPGGTAKIGADWYVLLTYGVTSATGTNTAGASGNDPYNMTTNTNSMLGTSFCNSSGTSIDWVLRLLPITYKVDLTNPNNPALLRIVAGTTQTISQETLANQIIGFKIGAALFNSATDTDVTTYCFNSQAYDPNCPTVPAGTNGAWAYNYTVVRGVMVSLIGRTTPVTDPTYVFRNTFDGGAYQIQGVSVVINPRNMSMTD
jgi:prepilin-type N-terminal cleavage/methylation domain-containing protein